MIKDELREYQSFNAQSLTNKEFNRLSQFIRDNIGINIGPPKKTLLETRIRKRLIALKIESFSAYTEYLFSKKGLADELQPFINCITTNKTDFYREKDHFSFMQSRALPELFSRKRDIRIWSSACSRGAEPYTIAFTMEDFLSTRGDNQLSYSILATDIDTNMLEYAKKAIYPWEDIAPIPEMVRKRYLMRSIKKEEQQFRIAPEIRAKVTFQQLNLTKPFHFRQPIDLIFCRNVIIYFNKETQYELIMRLANSLSHDGYLLMGHSEVLDTQKFPLECCAPAVYKKRSYQ